MSKSPRFITVVLFFTFILLTIQSFSISMISIDDIENEALIHDCVSVKTGEYCEKDTDLIVKGPDNIEIVRYYNSHNGLTDLDGWRLFSHCSLLVGTKKNNNAIGYAFCGEHTGSILPYVNKENEEFVVDVMESQGLVNNAKEISGQSNYKNNVITNDKENDLFVLKTGNGSKKYYRKLDKKTDNELDKALFEKEIFNRLEKLIDNSEYYYLEHEILPSGNKRFYQYDERGRLIKIEAKNALEDNVFGWVSIDYELLDSNKSKITIKASDSQEVSYYFPDSKDSTNSKYLLKKVKSTKNPEINYSYLENGKYLIKKETLEGRYLEVDYYFNESEKNHGKVQALNVPSNGGKEKIKLYSLTYDFIEFKNKALKEGITKVTNSKGAKWLYKFNAFLEILRVEKYTDDGALYNVKRNKWEKNRDANNLLAEFYEDNTGNIFKCLTYKYDNFGNIIDECIYGNLTGQNKAPLILSSIGIPLKKGNQSHLKKRKYSEDGFNLLIQEGDSKSTEIKYGYITDTNLLAKKFILFQGNIKKRYFYEYNDNATLINEIVDDGVEERANQAYSVVVRYITEIETNRVYPNVGNSLKISKKHFDSKQQIKLINEKVNTFNDLGDLLSQDFFDSDGNSCFSIKNEYDLTGKLTSHIDKRGIETIYTYDANNNVRSQKSKESTLEYQYDYLNNLIEEKQSFPSGLILIQKMQYDEDSNLIISEDIYGNTTEHEYDCFSRLIKEKQPKIIDENNEILIPQFQYEYDIFDNVIQITDPKGYLIEKSYNSRNQPVNINYPDNSQEMYSYDLQGSLHRKLMRDSTVYIYEYDYLGRIIAEEHFTQTCTGPGYWLGDKLYKYNAFDHYWTGDGKNHNIRYIRNRQGQIISEFATKDGYINYENKEGFKTDYIYDPLGRVISEKKWYGKNENEYYLIKREYDKYDQIIEETIVNTDNQIQTIESFEYDDEGNLTSTTRGNVLVEKISYNDFSQISKISDANKLETTIHYDLEKLNELGQKVLTIIKNEPNGNKTITTHDAHSRIRNITLEESSSKIISKAELFYDLSGNLSCRIDTIFENGKEVGKNQTKWTYGPMNRLEQLIEASGSKENERITKFEYNELGQLIKKYVPGLKTPIIFAYGYHGFAYGETPYCPLLGISYPILKPNTENELIETDKKAEHKISFDNYGNIVKARSPNDVIIERQYDSFNNLIEDRIEGRDWLYKIEYERDRLGRVIGIKLPDKSKIKYTYEGCFPKNVIRLGSNGNEMYRHTYDKFDERENLLEETLIEQAGKRKNFFDKLGRKIGIETPYESVEIPKNGFDNDGNVLKIKKDNEENSFSYDKLSQITNESGQINHSYEYDSLNNMLKIDDSKCQVDELNELLICGDTKFNYDARGFLFSKEQNNETTFFYSNAFGNLTFIKNPDKWTISNFYDVFGRRLSKSYKANNESVSKEIYLYIGNQEIGQLDDKNNIIQLQVPGPSYNLDTARSVSFELEEGIFAPTYDLQGNVISIIDSDYSEKIESYEYSVFGNEIIFDGNGDQLIESSVNNPWRFACKRKDEATGLINFGLREYDPNIGRWINPDPIGFADGMNQYAFVHNNPLKYIDLLGTSRHHGYKQCNSFEEYFYDNRTNEIKKGGDVFLVGGQAVVVNDHLELSGNFNNLLSHSIGVAADVADSTLGLLEIVTGFIGLGGSGAFEIGTFGIGTLVAAPVAAGSAILVVDGARRIENGYALFRKSSKNIGTSKPVKSPVRTEPKNLSEKLALEEAKAGAGDQIMKKKVSDPIYRNKFKKMQHVHYNADGSKTVVHYWEEIITGELSGFKIK